MEFEFWWIIALPLFFALGWIAARVDIHQLLSETTSLPAAYFRGLNFLISNQQDKAIEAFSEAVKANNESLELHFALGSLFRRSGEIDRAIHLHLSLLQRQELAPAQKLAVRAELAQDYLKAGLFDRAEEIFVTLTSERYQQAALRALLEIYTREREWQQSIQMATELERVSGVPFRQEIAQYHCELAVKAIIEQDHTTAKQLLEQALNANKDCVRANILLGDIEVAEDNHKVALSVWKRIEFQQPRYLALIAPKLLQSYKALGQMHEGIQLLQGYFERYRLHSLFNVLFDITLHEQGSQVAESMALLDLQRKPSLQTLEHVYKARVLNQPANAEVHTVLQTVRSSIGNRSAYCCEQCGFRAKNFHWQCPACNAWESLPSEPDESHL